MKVGEEMANDNVMSVEVAIRRELEYRRKMEALQFQLPSDSDTATIHAQEPPSVVGRKRKAPSRNLEKFPMLQPQPSCSYQPLLNHPTTSLACKVCELNFSNALDLKQHCTGQKHQMKLTRMRSSQKNVVKQDTNINNPYWCNLCQSGCSSAHTLEQHLVGRRHAASVQAMEDAKKITEQQAEIANIELESRKWQTIT